MKQKWVFTSIVTLLFFVLQTVTVLPVATIARAGSPRFYAETFDSYTAGTELGGANGWTVEYKNQLGEEVYPETGLQAVVEEDVTLPSNLAGRFADSIMGKTNQGNIYATAQFDRMTGEDFNNTVTVQFQWMQRNVSKQTQLRLKDGDYTIGYIFVNPSASNGLTVVGPTVASGAGGTSTSTNHLAWGMNNGDGSEYYLKKDTWHTIKAVIHFDTQTVQYYYNGSLKCTLAFISANATAIDTVALQTANDGVANVYLDNLFVVEGTDLSVVDPQASPAPAPSPSIAPKPSPVASPPLSDRYEWGNVAQGGGGFILSVLFHPLEQDLIYIRTDVGGAYRWDGVEQRWIPLCEQFTNAQNGLFGIDGFAMDPNDTNVVYMAAGKYTWSADADLYKSTNRGKTWTKTNLIATAKQQLGASTAVGFDGNGNSRGSGERVAVDPNNSNIIYVGTVNGGLWRSMDAAKTWELVDLPGFDRTESGKQPRTIVFDRNTAADGKSQTIYVGTIGKGLWKSVDGGATFVKEEHELIGNNTINRMEITASGKVYAATSKGLLRYAEGEWTDISPAQIADDKDKKTSFVGIAVDPTDETKMLTVFAGSDLMRYPIYRTTDGGQTWTNALAGARVTKTNQWLENDNFSSNTHCVSIDPFNPNRAMFTDFFSVWETKNVWETPTSWINPVWGIEEMVGFSAICPPVGPYSFISAVADNYGFYHTDINKYPDRKLASRSTPLWLMSATGIDFCENQPNIIAVVGVNHYSGGQGGYTLDGGKTWRKFESLPKDRTGNVARYGKIAVSADVNPDTGLPTIVIAPVWASPYYSNDMGKTWKKCVGTPDFEAVGGNPAVNDYWNHSHPVASDRVNRNRFYIVLDGWLYYSNDGGANWSKGASTGGWDTKATYLKAAPGMEGEVWASTNGGGFRRSSDGGLTWTNISFNTQYKNVIFGFGKGAPGRDNPAVYAHSTRGGFEGMFRSLDMGVTWERINDSNNIIGDVPQTVDGDRQNFGVVYVGTDGRGYYYGRPKVDLVRYQSNLAAGASEWALDGMTVEDGKLVGNGIAICQDYDFCRNFIYTLTMEHDSIGAFTRILLNVQDDENYYFIEFSEGSARLGKRVDGVETIFANQTVSYSVASSQVDIKVVRETGGFMTVTAEREGVVTTLFEKVQDSTFQQGSVGVLTTAGAKFSNITVENSSVVILDAAVTHEGQPVMSLKQAAGQQVDLSLDFRSNNASTSCLFVAAIKDATGGLQDVTSCTQILIDNSTSRSISIQIPEQAEEGWTLTLYCWDSFRGVRPFTHKVVF